MPEHTDREEIVAMLARFNQRACNAGFDFRVESVDRETVYVLASFDFAYYVNVYLQFDGLVVTDLRAGERWPDAWHQDQLFLLTVDEVEEVCAEYARDLPPDEVVHGFRFNRRPEARVVCRSLRIDWAWPAHPD